MTIIREAKLSDIVYITSLANKEGHAIGFIPKPAYEAAITGIKTGKRWSLTCNDKLWIAEENNDPVGFVLASFGNIVKVNQICIQEDARKIERGKMLLSVLTDYAENLGKYNFGCGCADDLESNFFWKAMGWQFVNQRKGIHFSNTWRESSKRIVNLYRYHIQPNFFGLSNTSVEPTEGSLGEKTDSLEVGGSR